MGILSYTYKRAVFEEVYTNIATGFSNYYIFAANPVSYSGNTLSNTTDDYSVTFSNDWKMLFGKKLTTDNIIPLIITNMWSSNTIYNRYDNTIPNLSNYYVIAPPSVIGASYLVYKCIDNANNTPSLYVPSLIQSNTFYTADNYAWRYMYSITAQEAIAFSSSDYAPIIPNNAITTNASNNSGVDVVVISNTGIGYNAYNDGIVQSLSNSNTNLLQISSNASLINSFYNNNAIYIYPPGNTNPTTSQLFLINSYVSNSSGNWVYTNNVINSQYITPAQTNYKISPAIIFNTDGITQPQAYSVINPTINSIANVVVISTGQNISRASVTISSNSSFGTGANLYAIVPPAGGHGFDVCTELQMQGYCVSFSFIGSEGNNLPTNISYNQIGLIKNPYCLNSDGSKSTNSYSNTYFNNMLYANTTMNFVQGSTVRGQNTGATGVVAASNSSSVYLVGDKYFQNNEIIVSTTDNTVFSTISINTNGNIYTKDVLPLYVQNINNVIRSNTNPESFKLVLQI